ncbi:MAG: DUF4249 family protein [Candidatus Kapabacteria bacterium]|jgi:hypothetical protein|nr:DUF4249 family protein [Candidatus Kapabacteria bacterium]
MKKSLYLFLFIIITVILASCEDKAPTDYIPSYFVEALLIVDEPIKDIRILISQPLRDSFNYDNSLIRNAKVQVIDGDSIYDLTISPNDIKGYYYPDTNYKIKVNTLYKLKVTLANGDIITGETTTPDRFDWITRPDYYIQYPKDTVNLPSPFSIQWELLNSVLYYIVSVRCLDTLNYGKYLDPPADEKNRRISRPWNLRETYYRDFSYWVIVPSSKVPIVWTVFKWYGLHEVSVYAPDFNFLRWMVQVMTGNLNPLLSSVKGAYGYFGSASVIRDTSVILKNQP